MWDESIKRKNAYPPQVEYEEREKEKFSLEMDEMMRGIPRNENAVIGDNMYRHVG